MTRFGSCALCEAICGLVFEVDAGRVLSVRGDRRDPLSRGHLCPKALALPDLRATALRTPLRKTGDGWAAISWDDAFDLVAGRLARVRKEHGADAVGVYLGNPTVHSLGAMTHGTAFFRMLRTRNRFSATSVDQLPHHVVASLLYGHQMLLPVPDIDRTDYFLVVGGNPMVSNGSLMTVPDFARRRRALADRGGRMVVFDPRRTETATSADEHHFVRPGTDAAVLLAMVGVILDDGLATPASYVDEVDEVRRVVLRYPVERAAEVSGVPAEVIRRIAWEFAAAPSAAAYGRTGVSTQAHGTLCQWAIQLLNILTGNLDRPGGTMVTRPAVDLLKLASRGGRARWRSRVRGLPEFAREFPVAALAEEITTPGAGRIRAMVVSAGNPVLSTPDGNGLEKALRELDFLVAIDFRISETARHADVILPPTTPLERDHYDMVFHALAVRDTARFSPAVLPKPADARHDWEIFRELGSRYRKHFRGNRLAALGLRVSPTRILDLLLRLGPRRLSVRALRRHPHGVDLGPLTPALPRRLRTPGKRIRLAPPELRAAATEVEAPPGLLLIGRRHLRANNSWMNDIQRLTKGAPRHHLLMHPDDLAERGIADGDLVRVESAAGAVEATARATDDVMRGVVSLPHGYRAASANDLTDSAIVDSAAGTAVLNGVPVTVQAAVSPPG
ncbi:Anaerobic selenocysteine-containing dehydrogenase [Actinokineospora iranica]|uniref:Anaerobic selenocysteine-containing dehydrogenase n=1 Tax=Actinokineospora iranica TaxID=1271860 RepID=A0A1G6SVT3_9PSEU|nr:Anaerobic selenocysteine-containing dehydrogenase [Actinokineospora iranica]